MHGLPRILEGPSPQRSGESVPSAPAARTLTSPWGNRRGRTSNKNKVTVHGTAARPYNLMIRAFDKCTTSRYPVERILTVSATCQQQNRQLCPFLTDAVFDYWAGQPPPTLLTSHLRPRSDRSPSSIAAMRRGGAQQWPPTTGTRLNQHDHTVIEAT